MGGIETDLLKYYSEAEIILINTCYFNHKPQHGNAANFNYFLRINFSYFSISTRPSIENIHAYRRIFLRFGDVLFWKYEKNNPQLRDARAKHKPCQALNSHLFPMQWKYYRKIEGISKDFKLDSIPLHAAYYTV